MRKSTKHGQDKGQTNTQPNEPRNNDYVPTLRDAYNTLRIRLIQEGYNILPNPDANFNSLDLYQKHHQVLDGLAIPEDFYIYKKVPNSDKVTRDSFRLVAIQICNNERNRTDDTQLRNIWSTLIKCLSDISSDKRNPLSTLAISDYDDNLHKSATLSGISGAYKCIPPLSWFPQNIQDYNPSDLLTLLPDAERKFFTLMLGRICVGASGESLAEGTVNHTFRSYGVLVGLDGGLGKSRLIAYLTECLAKLGYSHHAIYFNKSRYGWGEIASSDLAILDDSTSETQEWLYKSAEVKTIVSNGEFLAEQKYIAARQVKSRTVLLACTNSMSYSNYINMDSGSISRINQLYTWRRVELDKKYGINKGQTDIYWHNKALELNTTVEVLTARLLRYSVDQFLSVVGYELDDVVGLINQIQPSTLEKTLADLRAKYVIDVSLKHTEELIGICMKVLAARYSRTRNDNLLYSDFNHFWIQIFVELFLEPHADSRFQITQLSRDCRLALKKSKAVLATTTQSFGLDENFTAWIKELKSSKAFNYPTKSSFYQQDWMLMRNSIDSMSEEFKDITFNDRIESILDIIENS